MTPITLIRSALAIAALGAAASAQIVTTGVFTGDRQEGFELSQAGQFTPCIVYQPTQQPGIFESGGNFAGQLCDNNNSAAHVTSGWSFQCVIYPHSGGKFTGSAGGYYRFTFPQDVQKFGGYFGSHSGYPDATINFYDVGGNLLGTHTAAIPFDCQWHWNGWQTQGAAIRQIEVIGLNPYGGGFVLMDDLEIKFGSGSCTGNVASYCTAGTTTNGCVPDIDGTGIPSASAGSGFVIDVDQVEGQKFGLIFYGISGQVAFPWATGSNSWLCVKSPTQRMTQHASGGTATLCDGVLSTDWNQFIATNPAALGNPFAAGATVDAQAWFRDPPAVKTTNLSDALHFTVCQ